MLSTAAIFVTCLLSSTIAEDAITTKEPYVHTYGNFSYVPAQEEFGNIFAGSSKAVLVNFPLCERDFLTYKVVIEDHKTAEVKNVTSVSPEKNADLGCHAVWVDIQGNRLGAASLDVLVTYPNEDTEDPCKKDVEHSDQFELVVMRKPNLEQKIFQLVTTLLITLLNFGFGCSLNLDVVKEVLRRPIAPIVGFSCQYFMMPIIGTLVSQTFLRGDPLFGFGLLCSSCSPGGGGSNVWCLLLGGDVSLSLTMTFFSLAASIFMMPLWIFILSRLYIDPSTVKIPYLSIITQLAFFVVPCFIGVLIRKWRQNVGDRLGRMIKPFAIIFVVYLLSFGIYVNRYAFALWSEAPRILPPALCQPYLGFTMGFLIARHAAKQPKYRAITIAIETGIQNIAIPLLMLQGSFKQPYGDLAAAMPLTTALWTPLPLFAIFIGMTIYNYFFKERCGKSKDTKEQEDGDEEEKKDLNDNVLEVKAELKKSEVEESSSWKRDSLLIKNGITGLDLAKQFYSTEKESVI